MNHDPRSSRTAVLSWRGAGQGDPTRRGDRPTGRKVVTMTLGTGSSVRLNTPHNPRLHGSIATVEALTEWGAHVLTPAATTGRYRASDHEMEPLDGPPDSLSGGKTEPVTENVSDGAPDGVLVENAVPLLPIGAKPVSKAMAAGKVNAAVVGSQTAKRYRPAPATDVLSPTGNPCGKCGSMRCVRSGACEVCLDCGESGGCG